MFILSFTFCRVILFSVNWTTAVKTYYYRDYLNGIRWKDQTSLTISFVVYCFILALNLYWYKFVIRNAIKVFCPKKEKNQ